MLASVFRALARVLPVVGLAVAGVLAPATRADALQGNVQSTQPLGNGCEVHMFVGETIAYVRLFVDDQFISAGGWYFGPEVVVESRSIGAADLAACGLTNVTNLRALPATGTMAESAAIGFSFRATFPDDGKTYDVNAVLSGVESTRDDYSKTLANTAPQVETVGSVTVLSGQTVRLQAGAYDADQDPLTYAWNQTDLSGYPVVLTDGDTDNASFTAPELPQGTPSVMLTFEVGVSDRSTTTKETVSVIVRASNGAPEVNAGADQTVVSGAKVNLAATAEDPDGDRMNFGSWTADRQLTITGRNSLKASFTAPTLEPGADDLHIRLTFRIDDPWTSGSDSVTVTVKAPQAPPPPNGMPTARITGPETAAEGETVVLDGSQSTDPEQQRLVYQWEQMAGPAVIGELTKTTGASLSFEAPDVPDGVETVTLIFKLSVFDGGLWNAATHSVTVTRNGPSVEETKKLVNALSQARMDALIAEQVDLSGILGGGGGGSVDVAISSMGGTVELASAPDAPVWFRLSANWSKLVGAEADYALGAAGTHVKLGDGLALGVMAQVDRIASVDGAAVTKGTGWLIGPYVVARMPEQPVIVQGRLLYGATSNRLSPAGTYEDRFDGTRMLAQLGVSGEVVRGDVIWRPNLQASYGRERLDGYVDGAGNTVPGQSSAMSQVAAGLEVSFPVQVRSGAMQATVGLSNIWADTTSGTSVLEGYRGKLSVGVKREFASGAVLSVSGSYDGPGGSGLERYGLDLMFEHRF